MFLCRISAFIKKDFLIATSYKVSFVVDFLLIFVSILVWYFLAKVFGDKALPYLKDYGGKFFPFILIGIVLYTYMATAFQSYAQNLRTAQMTAILEPILATPIKISHLVVSLSLWRFIFATGEVMIYLLFSVIFLGIDLSQINILAAMIILVLSIISFSGIGIILASFVVVFKEGSRLGWVLSSFFALLGGVYFPTTVLPKGLQLVSNFLPITYSLRALRYAILKGASFIDLSSDIFILLLFSIILFPLSLAIFKYAVERVKREGDLSYY